LRQLGQRISRRQEATLICHLAEWIVEQRDLLRAAYYTPPGGRMLPARLWGRV
jgi:hypothetical protein